MLNFSQPGYLQLQLVMRIEEHNGVVPKHFAQNFLKSIISVYKPHLGDLDSVGNSEVIDQYV